MRSKWIPSHNLVMFAGRAALAATLALLCSLLLGLHEPHWAAWTAVSVGLPARGDGLLKSLNRAIGTAVGAPVGVLLVFAGHGNAPLLVGLLAAWLTVCVYAGLSLRHYRAYAAVLAGYSAVIIAMSLTGETGQLFEMGQDRCAGIFIGIASALLVLLLSRDVQSGHARRRIRSAIAAACAWGADRLAGTPRARAADGTGPQRLRYPLSDILALDGVIQSAVAESPALWIRAARMHKIVPALLDLLVVSRSVERNFEAAAARTSAISEEVDVAVANASVLLASIARALRDAPACDIEQLPPLRRQAKALRGALVSIQARNVIERRRVDLVSALLNATEAALRTYAALTGERGADTESYPAPVYARDRSYAIAGALRAGSGLLLAGTIWLTTGWQSGPLFVAFTAIAIALFAIRPDPRHTGLHFLASGAVGAGAALLFYAAISPHMPLALGVSLAEGSVVFLAIIIASLLLNTFWASGFCLVFLVVSDPESIAHTTATAVGGHAFAVLAGSVLAVLAFHLVPSRGLEHQWRKQRLKQIVDTIGTLIAASVAKQSTNAHHAWQSRSIDTLVRLALPAASGTEVDECMAWIEIGVELLKLQDASCVEVESLPSSAREVIDGLLADLRLLEPRSWHARLIAAETALRCKETSENQMVLGIRARVLELISLLKRAAVAEG
jgi:uncharacterized membrane protein YccC